MDNNRRDFLKSLSVIASATALPGFTGISLASCKVDSRMKLGLVTYLWGKDMDLPTLIDTCEKSGISGVELRSTHAHGVEPDISGEQRNEVKKRFEDSPVKLVSLGSAEEYNHPDPERLQKAIEDTKKFILLSKDVGGSGVKVRPNRLYDDIPHEQTIEQIGTSLNEVGQFAADQGQEIFVEVHGSGTSAPPVMKAIFEVVDKPNVGICWNCNELDLEGQGFDYNFNLLKDRFGNTIHVRELDDREYPYQKLISNLVKMNYKGWILLECRTEPEDKVKALIEQREVWEEMIQKS
ncbi:sugar phosphate isomerase/epimerase family protein [Bacteroidota bacterium]